MDGKGTKRRGEVGVTASNFPGSRILPKNRKATSPISGRRLILASLGVPLAFSTELEAGESGDGPAPSCAVCRAVLCAGLAQESCLPLPVLGLCVLETTSILLALGKECS